jgi:siroheme synthase
LSNHQCAGKPLFDWKGALSDDTTALIYMPGTDYEGLSTRLCADGLAPETPCLVISQATTTKQEVHPTTLANLADAPHYPAPVLLIVGAVAAQYAGESLNLPNSADSTASGSLPLEFALTNERIGTRGAPSETTEPAKQPAARNIELAGLEFA